MKPAIPDPGIAGRLTRAFIASALTPLFLLAAFALGLVLFIVTLLLNIVALRIVKRYREAYE